MKCEMTERWHQARRGVSTSFVFEQIDGSVPHAAVAIDAPGEKGFGISRHVFSGGARISAVSADHLIVIQPNRVTRMRCRIADDKLEHSAPAWNATICPAGARAEAACDEDIDIVILSIPVETVAFAALQGTHRSHLLEPRLRGRDTRLKRFVQNVLQDALPGDVVDPLWWNQATDVLIDHLLSNYTRSAPRGLGKLNPAQIRCVREHVRENLSDPLTVDMLAKLVGHSRAHFTRAFTHATGLTPHHYVMRSRLSRAYDLMRREGCGPASAAIGAGFADQSHLAAWTRRIFGTTTGRMRWAARDRLSTNLQDRRSGGRH
jgi:AraC family transcriptional regulator